MPNMLVNKMELSMCLYQLEYKQSIDTETDTTQQASRYIIRILSVFPEQVLYLFDGKLSKVQLPKCSVQVYNKEELKHWVAGFQYIHQPNYYFMGTRKEATILGIPECKHIGVGLGSLYVPSDVTSTVTSQYHQHHLLVTLPYKRIRIPYKHNYDTPSIFHIPMKTKKLTDVEFDGIYGMCYLRYHNRSLNHEKYLDVYSRTLEMITTEKWKYQILPKATDEQRCDVYYRACYIKPKTMIYVEPKSGNTSSSSTSSLGRTSKCPSPLTSKCLTNWSSSYVCHARLHIVISQKELTTLRITEILASEVNINPDESDNRSNVSNSSDSYLSLQSRNSCVSETSTESKQGDDIPIAPSGLTKQVLDQVYSKLQSNPSYTKNIRKQSSSLETQNSFHTYIVPLSELRNKCESIQEWVDDVSRYEYGGSIESSDVSWKRSLESSSLPEELARDVTVLEHIPENDCEACNVDVHDQIFDPCPMKQEVNKVDKANKEYDDIAMKKTSLVSSTSITSVPSSHHSIKKPLMKRMKSIYESQHSSHPLCQDDVPEEETEIVPLQHPNIRKLRNPSHVSHTIESTDNSVCSESHPTVVLISDQVSKPDLEDGDENTEHMIETNDTDRLHIPIVTLTVPQSKQGSYLQSYHVYGNQTPITNQTEYKVEPLYSYDKECKFDIRVEAVYPPKKSDENSVFVYCACCLHNPIIRSVYPHQLTINDQVYEVCHHVMRQHVKDMMESPSSKEPVVIRFTNSYDVPPGSVLYDSDTETQSEAYTDIAPVSRSFASLKRH